MSSPVDMRFSEWPWNRYPDVVRSKQASFSQPWKPQLWDIFGCSQNCQSSFPSRIWHWGNLMGLQIMYAYSQILGHATHWDYVQRQGFHSRPGGHMNWLRPWWRPLSHWRLLNSSNSRLCWYPVMMLFKHLFLFFSALLRYNWQNSNIFKLYIVVIWYM